MASIQGSSLPTNPGVENVIRGRHGVFLYIQASVGSSPEPLEVVLLLCDPDWVPDTKSFALFLSVDIC